MVGEGERVPMLPLEVCLTRPQMARETIHWDRPFHTVRAGSFDNGDIVWFPEGGLNASYNCVDRWAFKHPDKVCILRPFRPVDPSCSCVPVCACPLIDRHHLRSR